MLAPKLKEFKIHFSNRLKIFIEDVFLGVTKSCAMALF
jgi:hypothetical protein